ncbi:MAG: hypothetical protein HRT68_10240 [Flavobacteriaceae bacterium]|nr:hypothetical protein [Flavobacteriaceae bacterium]
MKELRFDIIGQLKNIRDYVVASVISAQDQIVLSFQLLTGEVTPTEVATEVTFIRNVYDAYNLDHDQVIALTDSELENYQIPTTFKS